MKRKILRVAVLLVFAASINMFSREENTSYDPSKSTYPKIKSYNKPKGWGLSLLMERKGKISDAQKRPDGSYQTERSIFKDPDLGGEVWKLTQDNVSDYHWYQDMSPWNADGSKIMFLSQRSKCLLMDGDGTNARDYVTQKGFDASRPCWSRVNPDLHYSVREGSIFEHSLKSKSSKELAKTKAKSICQGPSADGRYIICYGGGPSYLYDLQNNKTVAFDILRNAEDSRLKGRACKQDEGQLVSDKEHPVRYDEDSEADSGWFCVGSDGVTAVHAFRKREQEYYTKFRKKCHPGHPSWSPDGSMMIFYDREREKGIKLISKDGTREKYLVNNEGNGHISWLHSSSDYAFAEPTSGNYFENMIVKVFVTDEQLGTVHRIAFHNSIVQQKGKKKDYWAEPRLASSPDGTKIFWTSNAMGEKDVYFAVAKHPDPPQDLVFDNGTLKWTLPEIRLEIKGTLVYGSKTSGGPYKLLTPEPVKGTSFKVPKDSGLCFVVSSIEHSGLESRVYSNEAYGSKPGKYRLYYEAEDGDAKVPARLENDYLAAGDQCVWFSPGPAVSFSIPVNLPSECSYTLWARTRGQPDQSISFPSIGKVSVLSSKWEWVKAGKVQLKAGKNEIKVMCEKGGASYLDSVCLSDDDAFIPSGVSNLDSLPPEKVKGVIAKSGSSKTVSLNWEASKDQNFAYYELHGSKTSSWTPSNETLLFCPKENTFKDWDVQDSIKYYKIVAVDRAGNRSEPSDAAPVK
ncbi:MAG: hypothetical protein NTX32_04770 [Candidatus Firestonebacteria bacterium]|nr:hypothetical protein [Candidatus Firestonebacteria bacterium]